MKIKKLKRMKSLSRRDDGRNYMIFEKRLKQILKPKEYKSLMKFMKGQTAPSLEEIYDWDFMRWVNEQEVVD